MNYFLPILLLGILFANCGDDDQFNYQEQVNIDDQIIKDYLKENNLEATQADFGVYYLIEEDGEGVVTPTVNSTIIVKYKGYFPNGDVFDQADVFNTSMQRVIPGWQVGIPFFKKGAKGKIFIPSALGYGQFGDSSGNIPRNQVIIFDIELINFF